MKDHSRYSLSKVRADWLAANPFKEFVPDWLNPPYRALTPPTAITLDQVAQLRGSIDDKLNVADPEDLGKWKTTHRQRRKIEHQLADYLEGFGILADKIQKMRCCRMHGNWGDREHAGGLKPVIAWDAKCGEVRLCPDEARAEQRRLVRRYKPAMKEWIKARPTRRRIQKAVITWPNVPAGELAAMKRRMFKEHGALMKKFPVLRGALVSQEDPLSARGDWNIHLNVLYLVEGKFDWKDFRAAWHEQTAHLFPASSSDFQMDLQQLPRFDERALEKALIECIKYPVKHITEKPDRKKQQQDPDADPDQEQRDQDPPPDDDATRISSSCSKNEQAAAGGIEVQGRGEIVDPGRPGAVEFAPAMVDWSKEQFMEWWSAGLRFRRTRSYGALFKIGDPERDQDLSEVRWRGRVWWDHRASAYAVERAGPVDLIQGDKSGSRTARSDNFLGSGPGGADPPRYQ